jgi:hypothetical protein
MYNYNTVSGEASDSNRSIGHAMQVFNDLHYSNRCRFIGLAWPVAMVANLPLNNVQNHIIYQQ